MKRNLCVCVCALIPPKLLDVNIKLGRIEHHPGVSVLRGRVTA